MRKSSHIPHTRKIQKMDNKKVDKGKEKMDIELEEELKQIELSVLKFLDKAFKRTDDYGKNEFVSTIKFSMIIGFAHWKFVVEKTLEGLFKK